MLAKHAARPHHVQQVELDPVVVASEGKKPMASRDPGCRVPRGRGCCEQKTFPKDKHVHVAFLTQGPADHLRGERSRTCKRQRLPPKGRLGSLEVTGSLYVPRTYSFL